MYPSLSLLYSATPAAAMVRFDKVHFRYFPLNRFCVVIVVVIVW
jgi:hypothetical protein